LVRNSQGCASFKRGSGSIFSLQFGSGSEFSLSCGIRIKILLLIKQTKAERKEQNVFIFSQVPGELGGSGLDASGTPGPSAERSPGPPPVPALPAPPTPPDNPQNEEERRQVTFIPTFVGLKLLNF
jgi:hypothetical protein